MADRVELGIVIEDDGQVAGKPPAPAGYAPSGGGGAAGKPGAPAIPKEALAEGEGAAGAGEAAAGAEAAEAAAAGPAGIVILAAKKIGEELAKLKESITKTVSATQRLASNDNLGALSDAGEAAADVLGRIPVVGEALESSIKGIIGGMGMFSRTVDAFVQQGQRLARYSPDLAASGARADFSSTLSDLKEAMEIGPDLARLQDAQTELTAMLRDMLLPIKRFVVEVLASLLEKLTEIVRDGGQMLSDIYGLIQTIPGVISLILTKEWGEAVKTITTELEAIERRRTLRDREGRITDEMFRSMRLDLEAMARGMFTPPPRIADPVLGIPGGLP